MSDPIELHHPVTEESAREFVNATAPTDTTDEDKEQRVEQLLRTAAENNSWRQSRDPVERMELSSVPFASHPTEDAQPDTSPDPEEGTQDTENTEGGEDPNASA